MPATTNGAVSASIGKSTATAGGITMPVTATRTTAEAAATRPTLRTCERDWIERVIWILLNLVFASNTFDCVTSYVSFISVTALSVKVHAPIFVRRLEKAGPFSI